MDKRIENDADNERKNRRALAAAYLDGNLVLVDDVKRAWTIVARASLAIGLAKTPAEAIAGEYLHGIEPLVKPLVKETLLDSVSTRLEVTTRASLVDAVKASANFDLEWSAAEMVEAAQTVLDLEAEDFTHGKPSVLDVVRIAFEIRESVDVAGGQVMHVKIDDEDNVSFWLP